MAGKAHSLRGFSAVVVLLLFAFGCDHFDDDSITRESTFLYRGNAAVSCPDPDAIEDMNSYIEDVSSIESWRIDVPPLCYYPLKRKDRTKPEVIGGDPQPLDAIRAENKETLFVKNADGFNRLRRGETDTETGSRSARTSDHGVVLITQAATKEGGCPETLPADDLLPWYRDRYDAEPLVASDDREPALYCTYRIESDPPRRSSGCNCSGLPFGPR